MEIASALLLVLASAAAPVAGLRSPPSPPEHGADFTISQLAMAEKPLAPTKLEITDHVIPLKRGNSKSISAIYVQAMREQARAAMGRDMRTTVWSALVHIVGHIPLTTDARRTAQPNSSPLKPAKSSSPP